MPKHFIVIIPIALLIFICTAAGQEKQVPIEPDMDIMTINKDLENDLILFPDIENFDEAKLFRLPDSSYILEISYYKDDILYRIRRNMNDVELNDLRNKLRDRIELNQPSVLKDHNGRVRYLIGMGALSYGFYGWAIPTIMDLNGSGFTGMYLLTSGIGFILPFALTSNSPVSDGAATLSLYGGLAGIGHGALLYSIFGGVWDEPQAPVAAMFITSITELLAGYYIATDNNISGGKSEVLATMATFGTGWGLAASGVFDLYNDRQSWALSTLAGAGAGFVVGNAIANSQNYTRGDASVLANTGILGAALPVSLMALAEVDDYKTYLWAAMAGNALGIIVGNNMVKGLDFSASEGTYMNLASGGGALIGAGLGLLMSGDGGDVSKVIPLLSTVGGSAGLFILYSTFKDNAGTKRDVSSLDIKFSPSGVMSSFLINMNSPYPVSVPVVNFSYGF